MTRDEFFLCLNGLGQQGRDDVEWAENLGPPADADDFALETIFVICNSGMQNKVARGIYERIVPLLKAGQSASGGFGHKGKAGAIDWIWGNRVQLLQLLDAAPDKLAFIAGLPWIGGITKYHLAKNFGFPVAKPDVHLVRVAERTGESVQGLCERLARETGYCVATVDTIIWRACANGVVDSKTGVFR